jgi:hypothetical protein
MAANFQFKSTGKDMPNGGERKAGCRRIKNAGRIPVFEQGAESSY